MENDLTKAEHRAHDAAIRVLEQHARALEGMSKPVRNTVTQHTADSNKAEALAIRETIAALARPASLPEDEIVKVWQSMPGGPDGWLNQFGFLQFARAVLDRAALPVAAPRLDQRCALSDVAQAKEDEQRTLLREAARFLRIKAQKTGNEPDRISIGEWAAAVERAALSASRQGGAERDALQVLPSVEALTDLFAQALADTWHCVRVWEAWDVGTMSKDDFEPVSESDTPREVAEAVLALLAAK